MEEARGEEGVDTTDGSKQHKTHESTLRQQEPPPALPIEIWFHILRFVRQGKGVRVSSWLPLSLVCKDWHQMLVSRLWATGTAFAKIDSEQYVKLYKERIADQRAHLKRSEMERVQIVLQKKGLLPDEESLELLRKSGIDECKHFKGNQKCVNGDECEYLHLPPQLYITEEMVLKDKTGNFDPISTLLKYIYANCPKIKRICLPPATRPFHIEFLPPGLVTLVAPFLHDEVFTQCPDIKDYTLSPLYKCDVAKSLLLPSAPISKALFDWDSFTFHCQAVDWDQNNLVKLLPRLTRLELLPPSQRDEIDAAQLALLNMKLPPQITFLAMTCMNRRYKEHLSGYEARATSLVKLYPTLKRIEMIQRIYIPAVWSNRVDFPLDPTMAVWEAESQTTRWVRVPPQHRRKNLW